LQEVRFLKTPVNVGHADLDELAKLELIARLGDLDGAQLPRPLIYILKKVTMDCPQMGEVKAAKGYAFGDPLGDEASLDLVKLIGIGETKPVSKN
jgi:hypothetical protein